MTIKHFFFDKNCYIDKALSNRQYLENKLIEQDIKFSNILFLNQIHGNQVFVVDDKSKIYGNQNLIKADGIVTNLKNIAIAVVTADCAPIIMYDEINNIISATHSGWRGSLSNIVDNTIFEMIKLGAKSENIIAHIGPMIHKESYQVQDDFYDNFINQDLKYLKFFSRQANKDGYLFDLSMFLYEKIKNHNVKKIHKSTVNTYENKKYSSYRRSCHLNESECGRNISLAVIN